MKLATLHSVELMLSNLLFIEIYDQEYVSRSELTVQKEANGTFFFTVNCVL